ncbi:hypothetical protein [Cellulomonas sp. ES6]|uniref:hypothetical protein n=1 Tax=Cellulomonas sp. ES6 TaxID=3039384 RepID=UPI0024B761BC|nr:hypothetical protein [Cellulomonas sp. ES6]WHP18218.1 hypothetical protein P9841_03360 [Cellulomonas sp. ES6]
MSALPATARARSRRRTPVLAVLVVALVAVLSACGARVDTVFTLDDGPSGSRVMTLTLSRSDLDQYVSGGVAALEASIQNHKPAELDYAGTTVTEEAATATFTLTFDSADAYREKVAAVLAAGGRTEPPTIGLTTEDSLFLRGAAIEEDFTSLELLQWLADGLVADGTVSADNEGNILESGDTQVVYRGETTSAYQPISFADITDNGVTQVQLTTWLGGDGGYRRAVDIRMPEAAYASDPEAFDAYVAGVVPDGGELTVADSDGSSYGWVVTFAADDAATLATMTDQVLGSDGTEFSVTEEQDAQNPTRRHTEVVDVVSCDAICSPEAAPVVSTLVAPSGWEVGSTSADATVEVTDEGVAVTHRPTSTPVAFDHAIPFESIHVSTTIGFDRSVEQTLTFDVSDEDVAAAGDGFERLLTPADGAGELTTSSADGTTSYVLVFSAQDVDDYNTQIASLSPGASLDLSPAEGDGFWWSRYRVHLDLDLAGSVASGGVASPISYETRVPFGYTISEQDSAVGDAGTVDGRVATAVGLGASDPVSSIAVSGPTLAVLILVGVLLVLGLVVVVALVVFRQRVGAWIDVRVARRAEKAAARAAAAPAAELPVLGGGPRGDTAGQPGTGEQHAGPPVLVGPAAEQFSEADLV